MARMNWDRVRRERNLWCDASESRYVAAEQVGRTMTLRSRVRADLEGDKPRAPQLAATDLAVINEADVGTVCARCDATAQHIWSTSGGHRLCSCCGWQWQAAA